jgi:hypothetical protein
MTTRLIRCDRCATTIRTRDLDSGSRGCAGDVGSGVAVRHRRPEPCCAGTPSWSNATGPTHSVNPGLASSTFAIFEPRDDTDVTVANVESTGQDAYFDTAGEIAKYENIWADVVRRALDPEKSRDLIERALSQLP